MLDVSASKEVEYVDYENTSDTEDKKNSTSLMAFI